MKFESKKALRERLREVEDAYLVLHREVSLYRVMYPLTDKQKKLATLVREGNL